MLVKGLKVKAFSFPYSVNNACFFPIHILLTKIFPLEIQM